MEWRELAPGEAPLPGGPTVVAPAAVTAPDVDDAPRPPPERSRAPVASPVCAVCKSAPGRPVPLAGIPFLELSVNVCPRCERLGTLALGLLR